MSDTPASTRDERKKRVRLRTDNSEDTPQTSGEKTKQVQPKQAQSKQPQQSQAHPSQVQTQTRSVQEQTARVQKMASTAARDMYAGVLKEFQQQLQAADFQNLPIARVQDLLAQIAQQYEGFEREHIKIISTAGEVERMAAHQAVHREISGIYREMRATLTDRISALQAAAQMPPPVVVNEALRPTVVEVTTTESITNTWGEFKGDYLQWQSFRDRFKAAIHENKKLPTIRKFHFLRASVTGAAARAMGNWPFTEQNYIRAWNRLIEVYEDEYLVVQTLVRKLLSIPRMENQSFSGLRRIIDAVHECVNQLSSYVDTSNWDPIMVFMVVDLMDPSTYEAWESYRETEIKPIENEAMEVDEQNPQANAAAAPNAGGGDGAVGGEANQDLNDANPQAVRNICLPSWQEISAFLEKRARILVHAERRANKANTESQSRSRDSSTSSRKSQKVKQPQQQMQAHASTSTGRGKPPTGLPPCPLCKNDHPLYKCAEFVQLDLRARNDFVQLNHLCKMCLKPDHHPIQPCVQQACIRCPGQPFHNSLLCPTREADRRTHALSVNTQQPAEAGAWSSTNPDGEWGGAKKKQPKKTKSNKQN